MRPVAVRMPVSFATALGAYNTEQKRDNKSRRHRVNRAWAEALMSVMGENGRGYAGRCQVQSVAAGVVKVGVDNSSLAHELGVVYRRALLERLRELLKGEESLLDLSVRVVSNGALSPHRPQRFVAASEDENEPEGDA